MRKNSSAAVPPCPCTTSPRQPRVPRYIRRQNHARLGGLGCLAAHGREHYQRMGQLSAAARKGKRRPSSMIQRHFMISREDAATIHAIAAGVGTSGSFIVRQALSVYFASFGLGGER